MIGGGAGQREHLWLLRRQEWTQGLRQCPCWAAAARWALRRLQASHAGQWSNVWPREAHTQGHHSLRPVVSMTANVQVLKVDRDTVNCSSLD